MVVDFDKDVDLLKEKDDEAFRIIYEHTKKGVFSVIAGIIRDRSQIEDLMQDAYIKVIQNLNSYVKGRNFPAWVMQIAKNTAIDHYRKQKRITIHDPQTDMYPFDTETIDAPTSDLEVEAILKPLAAEERQIVLMKVFGELKFKEIATALGKPLGTVLWLYNKAIKKLRDNEGGETR